MNANNVSKKKNLFTSISTVNLYAVRGQEVQAITDAYTVSMVCRPNVGVVVITFRDQPAPAPFVGCYIISVAEMAQVGQRLRLLKNLRDDTAFDRIREGRITARSQQQDMDDQCQAEYDAERACERYWEDGGPHSERVYFDHYEEANRDKAMGVY